MQADPYAPRRQQLARQLAADGIRDAAVLQAIGAVPRHLFVPPELANEAYEDHPLPIGEGQTISQPFVVALMSSALALRPGDRVLEVGTGSGYQAAILAELGCVVYSVEVRPDRAAQAKANLDRAGYGDRVHQRVGDGAEGWAEQAPFDAILVTAAAAELPPALLAQLADGGRLIAPLGEPSLQQLVRVVRAGDASRSEPLIAVRFVPLVRAGG